MYEKLNIAERLNKSYKMISIVMGITALIGLVAMIAMSISYSNALVKYGFSQGDIGKAMVKFADTRSATRAIIGYSEPSAVEKAMTIREERRAEFEEYFATVKETLTTDEEEATYANIVSELETYWECDDLVVERGATTNVAKSKQAQMIAAEELDPQYDLIYSDLSKLLELNVNQGNALSNILTVISVVLAIVLIIIMSYHYVDIDHSFNKTRKKDRPGNRYANECTD